MSDQAKPMTFDEQVAAAVARAQDDPGVEHVWLNAFMCASGRSGKAD